MNAGFSIYVHWPFCQSKCPYCDFNSHVTTAIDHGSWAKAYVEEIQHHKSFRSGETLTSIYFGGGTPSLADVSVIDRVLNEISRHWSLNGTEITMEANPTSVEATKFAALSQTGVNRISIGFQAFNDRDLKRLGRLHKVSESLQALDIAKKYFSRTNFDLIYARFDQSFHDWQNELQFALNYAPDHISLYQLSIEEGTAFGRLLQNGRLHGLPSEDLASEMYEWTSAYMEQAGYHHYEISNFARAGNESRHNLVYWRGGDYIGVGPGAHGRLTKAGKRYATVQLSSPREWLASTKREEEQILEPNEVLEEYVMMGLRISEGIELKRISSLNQQKIAELEADGFLIKSNTHLKTSTKGRLVLNEILRQLLV